MTESCEWMVGEKIGMEKVHMEGQVAMEYILLAALVLHAWRNVL
jgi:hypothetical protein